MLSDGRFRKFLSLSLSLSCASAGRSTAVHSVLAAGAAVPEASVANPAVQGHPATNPIVSTRAVGVLEKTSLMENAWTVEEGRASWQ